jgi:CrcB protein
VTALLVVLGAAGGTALRLLANRALPDPRSTLLVNVLGSLVLGLCAGFGEHPYALLGIGFCGAFTTFSTFALDAVELPRRSGAGYVALSVVLCLGAAAIGLAVS